MEKKKVSVIKERIEESKKHHIGLNGLYTKDEDSLLKKLYGGDKVVVLRNGKVGIVSYFEDYPIFIVFESFSNPLHYWDDELKRKNSAYDIIEIRECCGKSYQEIRLIYKAKDLDTFGSVIWREGEK